MFNEIEETIVAILADAETGLPSDAGQPWHVPADHVGRLPPDLQGDPSGDLPAVAFAVSEFDVGADGYAPFGHGIGEVEEDDEGLTEIRTLRFDLLYRLDVWAADPDGVNAIAQRAVEILLRTRDELAVEDDDYRLLAIRPLAGRALPPSEQTGSTTVFRRQLDYRIESELLIKERPTPIREVVIREVAWQIDEG